MIEWQDLPEDLKAENLQLRTLLDEARQTIRELTEKLSESENKRKIYRIKFGAKINKILDELDDD